MTAPARSPAAEPHFNSHVLVLLTAFTISDNPFYVASLSALWSEPLQKHEG